MTNNDFGRDSVIVYGQWQHTIHFPPSQQGAGDELLTDEMMSATLPAGQWDYGAIVAAVVRARYSDDEATAIQLNMQGLMSNCIEADEVKAAEYKAEYLAFEQWRQYAKSTAKYFMGKYGYKPEINK